MDFTTALLERYQEQKAIIEKLPDLQLEFESLTIDCSQLPEFSGRLKKEAYRQLFPCNMLEDHAGPVVYYYQMLSHTPNVVWHALQHLKNSGTCTCPQMARVYSETNTDILYVGSERNLLMRRVAEHMGYANKDTGGLQLAHWAKALGLQLQMYYAHLDSDNKDLIRHVEAVLAKELNPLVGKREQ